MAGTGAERRLAVVDNPYAAPTADEQQEVKRWQAHRPFWLGIALLAVAWWGALLVPEESRRFLLEGDALFRAWGFVRVVGIVVGACVLYARLQRVWRSWSWLSAPLFLWVGCVVFVISMRPADPSTLLMAVVGPPIFVFMASYVVLPMTVVTALVIARLLPRSEPPP